MAKATAKTGAVVADGQSAVVLAGTYRAGKSSTAFACLRHSNLECLGDDRARFAIYGLRRAILGLPAARALAILQISEGERRRVRPDHEVAP